MGDYEDDWIENEPIVVQQPPPTANYHTRKYQSNNGRGSRGRSNESNWRSHGNGQNVRNRRSENKSIPTNKKILYVPSHTIGRIIGKGGSKIRELQSESDTRIHIGDSNGVHTDVTLRGTDDAISKAEKFINELIEYQKPHAQQASTVQSQSTRNEEFFIVNEDGVKLLDWEKFNAFCDKAQKDRLDKLPPIMKDFYKEDPVIKAMSPAEVKRWRKANHDIQVRRTFEDRADLRPIPNPVLTFEQGFQHYPEILEEIYKQDFKEPSPIQSQAWPILLRGDDLIGIAQTGTGKTLAFLLPALIHIEGQTIPRDQRAGPTALILAPTRELALQINKEVSKYDYKGIKSVCIYGGGSRKEQIQKVAKGVDIVIATPGRLNDLVVAEHIDVMNFSYIVLDEADRMLDMGFEPQIKKSLIDVRPDRQTVMTSATWPPGVRRLAETYMKDPIQVNVGSLDLAAVHTVTQKIVFLEEEEKDAALFEFLSNMDPNDKVIIFCGKKVTAIHLTSELAVKGVHCQSLHGDRDQIDRETALEEILDGTVNILIATDVASRGIDIKDLTHVVNLDFPRHLEEYVHRVGRTGRAGKTGVALSFITKNDWANARGLINILEEANQEVPDELEKMAHRFDAMKIRRDNGGGDGRGRGRGRFSGRGGRDQQRFNNKW